MEIPYELLKGDFAISRREGVFEVRVPGPGRDRIDRLQPEKTNDSLGTGGTLREATTKALAPSQQPSLFAAEADPQRPLVVP